MQHVAFIALGSNLDSRYGTPAQTVEAAAGAIAAIGQVESLSSLYCTEPVGNTSQPAFINAVLRLRTLLESSDLMSSLLHLERKFGRDRNRTQPKGPRTLDLDLLFFDDVILQSHFLTLPHPAIASRRFVLQPLVEIAAGFKHPSTHRTMAELLAALPDEGENRIEAVKRIGSPTPGANDL